MRKLGVIILCVWMYAITIAPAKIDIFVAPNGSDAWTGRLARANAARTDGPLQTLQAARDKARQWRLSKPEESIHIVLRGGIYYLPETLVLGPEDSGTAQAPVIWQAYPGETVYISGGRPIVGLKETTILVPQTGQKVRAWQAIVPAVKAGELYFRQLFVQRRGERFYTRRFRPHKGMYVVAGLTYSPQRKSMAHRAAQQDFIFFPGDLQPWQHLEDVEIVALHSWSASRLKIKEIDWQKHIVTFTSVPTFRIGHWYKDERNPYYVENIREELQTPGYWYLERPTGLLTYLPFPEEKLAETTLVAPALERLIVLQGDPEKGPFVEHVRFEGLHFVHSEWPLPAEGYDTSQGQPQLTAAIEMTGARFCGLEKSVIAHTGAYGVSLGVGCEQCFVRGCYMYDLGGGGVKIGDWKMNQQAQPPLLPVGNIVEQCLITNFGLIHYSANGVWAGIVRETKIRHNEIRHGPYTGIAVGWNWSPAPTSAAGNIIENNYVHHVMELVQDGGGIYTLGRQPGTIIRGNVIHDNHRSRFACAEGQCGLYFDEGSSGFLVEDNIVYDVDWNNCQIVQNRNTAAEHEIRTNYLGLRPEHPQFPKEIAARAGVEAPFRALFYPIRLTPHPVYEMQWPAMPAVPQSFVEDFEEVPVGMLPRRFSKSWATEGADVFVVDELAAAGKRSLRFSDKPGLPKPFYPYIYRRVELEEGPIVWEFDFRQGEPGGEAVFELRDYKEKPAGSFAAGPSFVIQADGTVRVQNQKIGQLPQGQWSHFKVAFTLGPQALGEWTLSVTLPDGTTKTHTASFLTPQFRTLTDMYIIANGTDTGSFFIDNLKLQGEK